MLLNQYFFVYKPFRVLSQFTSTEEKKSLKDFFDIPSNAYPVGRLDYDSEGLLIITNDKSVNHLLLNPENEHTREYLVQVEGIPSGEQIDALREGVMISTDKKKYKTKPCEVFSIETPLNIPERIPPVRFRKTVPDSWLRLVLKEGKNRQVRKMTASVRLPTLRLIRWKIENLSVEGMHPGDIKEITRKVLYNLLSLK